MNELLTLAIAPGVLWLLFVYLRVPGVTLILSILVGKLFAEELSQKLYDAANNVITINAMWQVQLFLLFLPVALSVILTKSKVSKSKTLSNSAPLLFGAVSLILFALPYIDLSAILGQSGQDIVSSYQSYIVSATGGIALLFAWSPDVRFGRKHKHR